MYLLYTVSALLVFAGAFIFFAWMNERGGNFTAWEGLARVFGVLALLGVAVLLIQTAPFLLLMTVTLIIVGLLMLAFGLLQYLR